MAGRRQRLLGRLRQVLRRDEVEPSSPASPGTARLSDGTVLERCLWVTGAELRQLCYNRGHPQLFIHWSSGEPGCVDDLPDLRELHLFWAHHVDFIAVAWEMSTTTAAPAQAAAVVDAWHRDYGLTWKSFVVERAAGSPAALLGLSVQTLPQVILRDAEDHVLFHRVGPLQEDDRARLALLLRERCSGAPGRA